MLSILIPTYNYNCFELVKNLNEQALKTKIDYEIIVMDDCSSSPVKENQNISNLSNCQYIELKENIGRAKIRNLLAEKARYKYLLFLDCDGALASDNFIDRYLSCCIEDNVVVCGGRLYEHEAPKDKAFYLHWLYGSKREVISVLKRQKNPNHSFMSNNFLISKNLFDKIRFNENIHKYGHEDTLFGLELKKQQIDILHIENPFIHIGLEKAEAIIKKEKDSIQNLLLICNSLYSIQEIAAEIKLLSYVQKISKLHLSKFMCLFYTVFHKLIENNLKSRKPILILLDMYKLSYFFYLKNSSEKLTI